MKKAPLIIASIAISLSLTACGSEDTEQSGELLRQSFQNFSIDIPSNWRKVATDSLANTVPEGTVALFLNRTEGSDFIQNTNVVKESLNSDATSLEYAKANQLLGSKAIVDYREISAEETVINGTATSLHLFRARNAPADPLRHYTQAYFSRDRVGYTATCISQEENAVQQQDCINIIQSFRFAN